MANRHILLTILNLDAPIEYLPSGLFRASPETHVSIGCIEDY